MTATILPLVLRELTFRANEQTLIDIADLSLAAGPLTLIIGPNGAGKSLLLRLCHGLLRPSNGERRWRESDIDAARLRQSFVFQFPRMLNRTALENVEYPLKIRGLAAGVRRARAAAMLERTQLAHLAGRNAVHLSGGEKQKLALARAWVTDPEVLFLDEPTASLDPKSSYEVERLIQVIHESGTKVVMTSHDLPQVRRLADEIVFLHNGRVVEHGAADRLLEAPRRAETAAFLRGELLV